MRPKLRTALGTLAGLSMMAMLTLDGPLRGAVLLLMSALGLKVWIAELKQRQEAAEEKRRKWEMRGANAGNEPEGQDSDSENGGSGDKRSDTGEPRSERG